MKLKVALLQIAPTDSLEGNRQKGMDACREAKRQGADIALFPEMWSNGYRIYDRPVVQWQREAIGIDSEFVTAYGNLAKELNMAIGVTLLEAVDGAVRNSLVLFDRFGEQKFVYAKVHTCDFDVERYLAQGDDFYVTVLDTAQGEIRVGAMICYDREFPESARILMLKGAELIVVPNACPMEINRLSQLRGRAYENMVAIATCNYPECVPDCNGGSTVFDGVAYLPELAGSRDTCLLQAGGEEGIYVAELDVDMLRKYRESEVHGNAYRRPSKYAMMTDSAKKEPFLRNGYRGVASMEVSRFFKSIIDQDTAPVVICDLTHTVVYMNPASVARYHVDLTGKSIKECHNGDSNEKIERVVAWFAESKENNVVYTYRNDKENKDVYMVALRDDDGALIGYYEKHEYRNRETGRLYAKIEG